MWHFGNYPIVLILGFNIHWEKRFDWIKEKYLFERLSLI